MFQRRAFKRFAPFLTNYDIFLSLIRYDSNQAYPLKFTYRSDKIRHIKLCANLKKSEFTDMRRLFKNYIFYVAILFIAIIVLLSARYYGTEFYGNILVEMHGVIFDTLILGLIITIWDKKKDRKSKIELLKKELELYKAWKSPESSFRIYNIYKSLEEFGIKADLSEVNFEDIKISDLKYHGQFFNSIFKSASLINCDIRYASFKYSNISDTGFFNCDFRGANFLNAEILDCEFYECSFNSTIIESITFKNVKFENIDFKDAHFRQVNFISCTFIDVSFGNTANYKSNFGDNYIPEGVFVINDKEYIHEPTKIWIMNENNNIKKPSKIAQRITDRIRNGNNNHM